VIRVQVAAKDSAAVAKVPAAATKVNQAVVTNTTK
jgi:hypothetical protein